MCSRVRVMPFPGGSPGTSGRPVVVGDDGHAVGQERPVAVHRMPLRHGTLGEPELVQRAQRVPRLNDPDAVDVPGGVLLDDVDVDARPAQRDRRRKTADPASDDENVANVAHFSSKSSVEWNPAVAASATAASTGGQDSIIESGICRFFHSVVPPCCVLHFVGCQSGW